MEDRMAGVQPLEFSLGNGLVEVFTQNVDLVGAAKKFSFAKVIGHDETAPADVLSQVGDLLVVQQQEPGLREIQKWILKDLIAIEPDDLVGTRRDANSRQFMQERFDELVGFGIVMLPGGTIFQDVTRPVLLPVAAAHCQTGEYKLGLRFRPI